MLENNLKQDKSGVYQLYCVFFLFLLLLGLI